MFNKLTNLFTTDFSFLTFGTKSKISTDLRMNDCNSDVTISVDCFNNVLIMFKNVLKLRKQQDSVVGCFNDA